MLETLGVAIGVLFLLGLSVFGVRLLAYIFSGRYKLDQRIDRSASEPFSFARDHPSLAIFSSNILRCFSCLMA